MANNNHYSNNSGERASATDAVNVLKNSHRAMPPTCAGISGSVTVIKNKGRSDEQIICKDNPNLVTTVMIDEIFRLLYEGSTAAVAAFKYIGLSSNTDATITAGLTELEEEIGTGSITGNGLQRAEADAFTHTDGQNNVIIENEFTATDDHTGVVRAALFNAASGGIMGHIDVFPGLSPAVNMNNQDTLTVTWTITIT